jgi:hypothetical protein
MRIESVPAQPLPPIAGNAGNVRSAPAPNSSQNSGAAASASAAANAALLQTEPHGGGGGGGHGKKALEAIRQAGEKAAVNVQPRRKTAEERQAEIARLKAMFQAQSRKVAEREPNEKERAKALGMIRTLFHGFVQALGAAFVANNCPVRQLNVDDMSARLAVLVSEQTQTDTVSLLLLNIGDDSKITVLIDHANGTPAAQLEVPLKFTPEQAQVVATQAIAFLRPH